MSQKTPTEIMTYTLWNIAIGLEDPKAAATAALKEAGYPAPGPEHFAKALPAGQETGASA